MLQTNITNLERYKQIKAIVTFYCFLLGSFFHDNFHCFLVTFSYDNVRACSTKAEEKKKQLKHRDTSKDG